MQTIYLDISNKGVIPTIYAKQGDIGRKFEVFLTDSGLPYVPTSGSAFSVWYSGASGEGNYTDIGDKSAFSVNGNKVAVEMISQMLLNDGDGVLSLVLNDPNGNQISTWNIPYVCESVPGANSEEAKSYYTAFSKAVEDLPYPDTSLTVPGKAADAAAVGTALAGKASAGSVWTATDPNNDGNIVLQYGGNVVPGGGGSGGSGGGSGITGAEKALILTLFRNAAYTSADMGDTLAQLEALWIGGEDEPDEPVVPDEPDEPVVPDEPDEPVVPTYTITAELVNATSSNVATSVNENASYTTTLTAADGYTLYSVTVTMGGVDVTADVYADGVISIPAVTGNVEIVASAVEEVKPAELPTDGLLDFFDLRSASIEWIPNTSKAYGYTIESGATLFSWHNIASNEISNVYGVKGGVGSYSHDGKTTSTDLGDEFTVIQLLYGSLPLDGFTITNVNCRWATRPSYVTATGRANATQISGADYNADNKYDWNFAVYRVNGSVLDLICDTSKITYNGEDFENFVKWTATVGNGVTDGTGYSTAFAVYNRALTDIEIEEARAFFETWEVTA